MTFVVLGLGSNRSWNNKDSLELLYDSCRMLEPFFSDFRVSSVYSSKPMYVEDQSDFYNMAVCGYVDEKKMDATNLLAEIHRIETSLGRNRCAEIRNGPRSIDIDIEIYGKKKILYVDPNDSMKNLEIPHPRLQERAFVLIPMLEILPEDADFINRKIFSKFLEKIGTCGVEKKITGDAFFSR